MTYLKNTYSNTRCVSLIVVSVPSCPLTRDINPPCREESNGPRQDDRTTLIIITESQSFNRVKHVI